MTSPGPAPTRVREVMTREVVTLSPTHSFHDAVSVLASRRFHHVLVTDATGALQGVISDRDLLRFMAGHRWEDATVADVMVPDVLSVGPETLVSAACEIMIAQRINCLPVVDEGKRIVGILTSTDLLMTLQRLQAEIEGKRRAA